MSAHYLIRFDDICPTMNWKLWSQIEAVLLDLEIRPILAVVPDNQDKKLMVAPPHGQFWEQVREWQARGWTIGLHGYQHLYVNRESGILGFAQKSEFAGVPAKQQEDKLRRAIEIFARESVTPEIWIAPAHSFDRSTLTALNRIGIRTISDGFALSPHTDQSGIFWVPQQLWQFRWRPIGMWTVCYHHNSWSEKDLLRFHSDVKRYRKAITMLASVRSRYEARSHHFLDGVYSKAHGAALVLKRSVGWAS
jgi:predicted deacetylase